MKTTCPWAGRLCRYTTVFIIYAVSSFPAATVNAQDLISDPPDLKKSLSSDKSSDNTVLDLFQITTENFFKSSSKLKSLADPILYNIDHKVLKDLSENRPNDLTLNIPVRSEKNILLTLRRTEIFTSDYFLSTSSGIIKDDQSKYTFYHGTVEGKPEANVSLSLNKKALQIVITDNQGTYQLSSSKRNKKKYSFFNTRLLNNQRDYDCLSDFLPETSQTIPTKNDVNKSTSDACIPVYVETDMATLQFFNNSIEETEQYIVNLMNEVAIVFAQEGINVSLSQIHITDTNEDDFSQNFSFAEEVLEEFARVRKNHYQGRLAHFITNRNLLGGIAWTNVLCNTYSLLEADMDGDGIMETHHFGPYAVSSVMGEGLEEFPIYSWDVGVFTHEMGHNLGASHTHSCVWGPNNQAIDNCVNVEGTCNLINDPVPDEELGTIMSYCHLSETGIDLSKGFGTLPGALILSKYQNANCILSCDNTEVPGCTDSNFHDYDPFANSDDGSCSEDCSDQIKNGDETGIDCGGQLCLPCVEVCISNYLLLKIILDSYPTETSWVLKDSTTQEIIETGGPYGGRALDTIIAEFCLPYGTYSFTLYDQFGDGICCSTQQYQLVDRNGIILFSGGDFGEEVTHHIRFEEGACPPTLSLANEDLSGTYMAGQRLFASNSQTTGNLVSFMSPEVEINQEFTVNMGVDLTISNSGCQ